MADSLGNLIKIWGDPTETAVDLANSLQDGMLAYCPFEKVAVWRKDSLTYETIPNVERVIELIDQRLVPLQSDSDVPISDPSSSTLSGTAETQQEANQEFTAGVNSNKQAISGLANVSLSIASVGETPLSPTPTRWDFITTTPSNDPLVLDTDDVNNIVYFRVPDVRYTGQAQMTVTKTTGSNRDLTIVVRRADNDAEVRRFDFVINSPANDTQIEPIPVNPYDNTEEDYGIYYEAFASASDVTINSLNVNYNTNGSGGNTNPSVGSKNLNMSDGNGGFVESNVSQRSDGTISLPYITINSPVDLNNLKSNGNYKYTGGIPPLNSPSAFAYFLSVIGDIYPTQVAYRVYTNEVYTRCLESDLVTWTDWVKNVTSDKLVDTNWGDIPNRGVGATTQYRIWKGWVSLKGDTGIDGIIGAMPEWFRPESVRVFPLPLASPNTGTANVVFSPDGSISVVGAVVNVGSVSYPVEPPTA